MITIEIVNEYLSKLGDKIFISQQNTFYADSIEEKAWVADTFSKDAPKWLIDERPKETSEQKEYRKDLYGRIGNNITGYKRRISRSVQGIKNISDYKIGYNLSDSKDNPYDYLNKYYPLFGVYEDWFWKFIPEKLIDDANGVIYALPNPQGEKIMNKPRIYFTGSEGVLAYRHGEFCILISEKKSDIIDRNGILQKGIGNIVIFFDHKSYCIAEQVKEIQADKPDKAIISYLVSGLEHLVDGETGIISSTFNPPLHLCETIPVLKVGMYQEQIREDGQIFCKSLITDAIPDLRRSIMLSFDLAIEYVFHSATEEWRTVSESCKICNGTGKIGVGKDAKGCSNHNCSNGKVFPMANFGNGLGTKYIPNFAVTNSELPTTNNKGGQVPLIGGFIERNHKSAELFDTALRSQIKIAFMWSSMEYIFREQGNQSGEAKKLDKDDAEQFFLTIAQHLCGSLLQSTLGWITSMLYPNINQETKDKIKPIVRVPKRFNLETADEIFDKITASSKEKLDQTIVNQLKMEYAEKEYGIGSLMYNRIDFERQVDPFSGKSDLARATGIPTLEWWRTILSTQIATLVYRGESEHIDFWDKKFEERKVIVEDYAKAIALLTVDNQNREYPIKNQVNIVKMNQL